MKRRDLLKLGAWGTLGAFTGARGLAQTAGSASLLPWFALATSMNQELNYAARVEGQMPRNLIGTLFRNGPGLFERAGWRKQHILDGDGMIRCYRIASGGVTFQNRFVRTSKYLDESNAGHYLYSTWASQLPGGPARNAHPDFHGGQAGISVRWRNGQLFAFDESLQPYQLEPQSLSTRGVSLLGLPSGLTVYSAHPKEDPVSGAWIHFGTQYGPTLQIHLTEFDRTGKLSWHRVLQAPRYVYVHDFFVTEHYIVLYLQPAFMDVASWQAGGTSLLGCIQWRLDAGGLLLVVSRGSSADPIQVETEPVWMWHGVNAYERGSEIVADCVAYDNPNTFLGPQASWRAVMTDQQGLVGAPGAIRRFVIAPQQQRARMETLDTGNHEFPTINPAHALRKNRYGYFGLGTDGTGFWNAIVRMDMLSGRRRQFSFEAGQYCAEPIFAARQDRADSLEDEGWLLVEVLDSRVQQNCLAVFRSDRIDDGPVAKVWLTHTLPLSFHGCWAQGV